MLLASTALVAVVQIGLTFLRCGFDGTAQPGTFLGAIDSLAGLLLCILCFALSLQCLLIGGDPPGNGIIFLLIGITGSSLVWGIFVERIVTFFNATRKNG